MEEKVLIEAKNLKKYFKVGANSQLHAVDGVNFNQARHHAGRGGRVRLRQVHAGPPAAAAL